MKEIRMLRSLGAGLPPLVEGQEAEVADDLADQLCGAGLAVLLRAIPEPPQLTGIPPEAIEGTVEHATEKLKAYKARQTKPKTQHKE